MPLVIAALAILVVLALVLLAIPLGVVLRYRAGVARRQARGWVVTFNLLSLLLSTVIFLVSAAITSLWVPDARRYSLLGIGAGVLLGMVGLVATRWQRDGPLLFFTPSRVLVLAITLLVTARIGYGFWRAWHAWQTTAGGSSWLERAGVADSLAAGGVVLGYYLAYFAGLRWKLALHRRGR